MNDELVHLPSFISKSSRTVTAAFGGAELDFKERAVPCTDDCEIVRHCDNFDVPGLDYRTSLANHLSHT